MTKKPEEKIRYKGMGTFRHDLFKAEVDKFKKNVSWVYKDPRIEEVEHCHFYHSHNSSGRPQRYTSSAVGHFHEVTVSTDDEGNLVAECGPPLEKIFRTLTNGQQKSEIVQIAYFDQNRNDYIRDDHRHDMTYLHSEELSSSKVQAIQTENEKGLKNAARSEPQISRKSKPTI